MNKRIIYLGLGIFLVILIGINVLFSSLTINKQPVPSTAPTTAPNIMPKPSNVPIGTHPSSREFDEDQKKFQEIAQQEEPIYQQWNKVASMRKSLPYYGKLFSLFYDYSKASFILTLNKSNIKEGTKEFNAFLQTNGIQNETWT
jgi:hypothetical protein